MRHPPPGAPSAPLAVQSFLPLARSPEVELAAQLVGLPIWPALATCCFTRGTLIPLLIWSLDVPFFLTRFYTSPRTSSCLRLCAHDGV